MAEINDHGAWFAVGQQGLLTAVRSRVGMKDVVLGEHAGYFATVNGAADAILAITGFRPADSEWAEFKHVLSDLRHAPPGTIDCFYDAYPIIWYDPSRDGGEFDVQDWEAYEAALAARGEQA